MSIPAQSARVVVHANLASQTEEAEWGWWMNPVAIASDADAQALADSAAAAVQGQMSALAAVLSADCAYDKVTVYCYPQGGTKSVYIAESPLTSGTGTGVGLNALQIAMVVTLRTGLAGRSRRGRMYLPAQGILPTVNHVWSTTQVSNVVNAVAAVFTQMNVTTDAPRVCVVSQTLGQAFVVTDVDADQRADVQRRRAGSQNVGTRQSAQVSSH